MMSEDKKAYTQTPNIISYIITGQFICGSIDCSERDGLTSWEVNFAYKGEHVCMFVHPPELHTEHGENRHALVKIRLCEGCSIR